MSAAKIDTSTVGMPGKNWLGYIKISKQQRAQVEKLHAESAARVYAVYQGLNAIPTTPPSSTPLSGSIGWIDVEHLENGYSNIRFAYAIEGDDAVQAYAEIGRASCRERV